MIKKSVCIEMLFTEVPFEDRFRLAGEFGFDYIEFWSWKDKDVRRIKELCRMHDLKVASFSGDQDFSMIDEHQMEDYAAFVDLSIETARFLDCGHLVIHSNALGENGRVINDYSELSYDKKNAVMSEALRRLAPRAAAAGIILVLEPLNTLVDHEGNFLSFTREAAELVRFVNSSHLKILYDIYHMQIMEGNLIATLEEYIDAIGYIHIADVPGRHEPGTGEINFANVMKTLDALKYNGIIGFELTPAENSEKAVRSIKQL
jgi:hydroxypyruvate isomerase